MTTADAPRRDLPSPSIGARAAAGLMAFMAALALTRHGLRLALVQRLLRSGVLAQWPWSVDWPWVAAVSVLVLAVGLPWWLAFVGGAAWARRGAGGLGLAYLGWTLTEHMLWTPTRPALGQMTFTVGLIVFSAGLWWTLARRAASRFAAVAPPSKEVS